MRRLIGDLGRILDQWNECRASPTPCPSCGSTNVKVTSLVAPVQWKCRACKRRYSDAQLLKSC